MRLNFESYTPEKSEVVTKINGSNISQRIKYINKKGAFKSTEQCKECCFRGKVQIGLGFAFDITCDRDIETWRMRTGKTDKVCKHYKLK